MSIPARSVRPLWSTLVAALCAVLLTVCLFGLAMGRLASEQAGYVVAQQWDHPYLWLSLAAAAATIALAAWQRWRWGTLIAAVLAVPTVWVAVFAGAFLSGVGRGTPVVSPTGEWAVRVDNRGFQDPLYAVIALENEGLTSRYWQAGNNFFPDPLATADHDIDGPRWTSDDTFELTPTSTGSGTVRFRMTHQGPVQLS